MAHAPHQGLVWLSRSELLEFVGIPREEKLIQNHGLGTLTGFSRQMKKVPAFLRNSLNLVSCEVGVLF